MDSNRLETAKSSLLACVACAILAAACVPAVAAAQGTPSGGGPATGGQAAPGSGAKSTEAGGADALSLPTGALAHQLIAIGGTLPAAANAAVEIQRLDPATGTWSALATTTAGDDGSFTAHWRADRIGRFTLRAVAAGAGARGPAPTSQLTIYRAAQATWFGPGFYGKRTACGEIMSPTLLGVAHRSLPCGTLVDVSYGGRSITVPVVDRGPYAHGVSWDLTTATARALNFDTSARIGALALRDAATAGATRDRTARTPRRSRTRRARSGR